MSLAISLLCTSIWKLLILNLERIQHRATKYILNDYTSCYKHRLINLRLLPLMYMFELQDILFAIKSPTNQFNINNYITFNSTNTRSGSSNKLLLPQHLNNISRHSYFHRLPSLWNAIPILDLNMSVCLLKSKLKSYLWDHFLSTALPITCVHAPEVTKLNLQLPILTTYNLNYVTIYVIT